jgi:NADPH2:quinone reductase
VPTNGLRIVSTVTADATLRLDLAPVPVTPPAADQVVVRIEAAPINPSDLMTLLSGADTTQGRFSAIAEGSRVEIPLSERALQQMAGRIGSRVPVGQEGAGVVVAAGERATDLLGATVAVLSAAGGMFAQYQTVNAAECIVVPDGITPAACASIINPLTALAITETARTNGHRALIHTAAASNLGQMLVKICAADGIPLVNIVRTQDQVEMLKRLGAQHVCDSSQRTFREDLVRAIHATGATVAFDAVGGGTMAGDLLSAMEAAALSRLTHPSPFGSFEPKQVHVYGHLDTSPTVLNQDDYGLVWGLSGWAMPSTLARIDPKRVAELRQRVLRELETTFASDYGRTVALREVLHREVMLGYSRQGTGGKYLIKPWE